MESIDRILRRAFPSRDAFSGEEVAFASAVLDAAMGSSPRSAQLPTKYVEVGGRIAMGPYVYECVEADRVSSVADACVGCDFCRLNTNCSVIQCSAMDRRDRRFVWFRACGDGNEQ